MDWSGVDYLWITVMFLSDVWTHSDGTHSLQRIHCWASEAMLNFAKSVLMKRKELIYIFNGLRVNTFSTNFHFWLNHSFCICIVWIKLKAESCDCTFHLRVSSVMGLLVVLKCYVTGIWHGLWKQTHTDSVYHSRLIIQAYTHLRIHTLYTITRTFIFLTCGECAFGAGVKVEVSVFSVFVLASWEQNNTLRDSREITWTHWLPVLGSN